MRTIPRDPVRDHLPSADVTARFGYTRGSFRVLVHQFRSRPGRDGFLRTARQGLGRPPGETARLRDRVRVLREQHRSVHDIGRALILDGEAISPAAIATILEEEGLAKLPRRRDEERPEHPRPCRSSPLKVSRAFGRPPRLIVFLISMII